MSHRINRLRLEVQAESAERAFSIRRQLRDDWQLLVNELEANFDALAGDDSWLRIPRLHFRIRVANTRDLDHRLPALLRETIDGQLPPQMRSAIPAIDAIGTPRDGDGPATDRGHGIAGAELQAEPRADTRADRVSLEQLLEHYLLLGKLPWFAREAADWRQRFAALIEDRFAPLLSSVVDKASAAPALRLLNLIEDAPLLRLLESWLAERPATAGLRPLLGVLLQPGENAFASQHQRSWVVALLLAQAAFGDGSRSGGAASGIEWRIPPAYRLARSRWRSLLRQAGFESLSPLPFDGVCAPGSSEDGQSAAGEMETARDRGTAPRSSVADSERSPGAETSTQPVNNAGLVLLHPYLARYFKACGIDLESAGARPEDYDFAAAALYFLAAGDARPAEYELGLIKVLLGLEPDHPLPLGAGLLEDAVKSEANLLLDSFIGHWSALKSTSREGLRQAFLQRPGLLGDGGENWLLQVEPGGVDVLLDRLPFSYSIVKLPWMQKPIRVEW